MLRIAAHTVSYLFHPLLMPTYLVSIILFLAPTGIQPQLRRYLIAITFAFTGLLPALNFFFLKSVGAIKSLHMPTRQARVWPFVFMFLLYAVVTGMFYLKMPITFMVNIMWLGTGLAAVVCVATVFFKVSVHAVVGAGFAGILLNLSNLGAFDVLLMPALIAVVIAGLVMSSRLLLNAHTLSEVGWGGVLGFTVGYVGVMAIF